MNPWARYIIVLVGWGLFCGIFQAPAGVAFVGGIMLGFWYSLLWLETKE